MRLTILAGLSFLLSIPLAAVGEEIEYHGLTFAVPEGWSREETQAGYFLAPPLAAGETDAPATILVSQPVEGQGATPTEVAEAFVAKYGAKVVEREGPESGRDEDSGVAYAAVKATIRSDDGSVAVAFAIAMELPKGIQLLVLFAVSAAEFDRYLPSFQAFLEGADAVGSAESPPEPAQPSPDSPRESPAPEPGSGGLGSSIEIWTGVIRMRKSSRRGGFDYYFDDDFFVFLPDGRYAKGVPSGGLRYFDPDAWFQERPGAEGTYEFGDGTLVTSKNGNTVERSFERLSERVALIDGDRYRRVYLGENDMRLEGTYVTKRFLDTSASDDASSAVVSENSITFAADGAFRTREFVGHFDYVRSYDLDPDTSRYVESTTGNTESLAGEASGAYRITPGTLELFYADGHGESFTFFAYNPPGEEEGLTSILLDGVAFLRP